MSKLKIPAKPGIYTLIIDIAQPVRRKIGKLGYRNFALGLYTYTGSAIGKATNLRNRISRHIASEKKTHWHIDYLLSSEAAAVGAVVYVETPLREECQVAKGIKQLAQTKVVVRGFGASDCRSGCASHLHYFPGFGLEEALPLVISVYKQVFCGSTPVAVYVSPATL